MLQDFKCNYNKLVMSNFFNKNLYYLYCMKQRIYIDTSVFGGYFDEEFSNEDNK